MRKRSLLTQLMTRSVQAALMLTLVIRNDTYATLSDDVGGPFDLLDSSVSSIPPEILHTYEEYLSHVRKNKPDKAIESAARMRDQFADVYGENSPVMHAPTTFLGMVQIDNEKTSDGLVTLQRSVNLIEAVYGNFAFRMVAPLRAIAVAHERLGDRASAVNNLQRAQHLTHRQGGVYAEDQLPIVDQLITLQEQARNTTLVDTLASFYLRVHEDLYGEDDPRVVPALLRSARLMTDRGTATPGMRMRQPTTRLQPAEEDDSPKLRLTRNGFVVDRKPGAEKTPQTAAQQVRRPPTSPLKRTRYFNTAYKYYDRAIRIIEDSYGGDNLRLVAPLRGLARAKFQRAFGGPVPTHALGLKGASTDAMRRIANIVSEHPASDVRDIANSIVDLADLYTIWNDSRADAAYKEAWDAIPGEPRYDMLRAELFGEPTLIYPRRIGNRLKERYWNRDRDNYVELGYIVRANGRARRFETLESTVGARARHRLQSKLTRARFRPRVVNGEVVRTEGLVFKHKYEVY
jgi:hypothetical protein